MKCDYCFERDLRAHAASVGGGVGSKPMPDSRNPRWILTQLYVVECNDWGEVRGVVACPGPQACVCDRPPPAGKQVYGNSRDPAWPHKCPECGYHAAVVVEDGVTVLACRSHACAHSYWKADPIGRSQSQDDFGSCGWPTLVDRMIAHERACAACLGARRVYDLCSEGAAILARWDVDFRRALWCGGDVVVDWGRR